MFVIKLFVWRVNCNVNMASLLERFDKTPEQCKTTDSFLSKNINLELQTQDYHTMY